MKKILVFGITENPGGVESVIMNYYRNIDKNKVQFDFLCNTEIVAYEDEIKSLGGKIYRVTARSKNFKQYKQDMKNFYMEYSKEYDAIWVNICSLANIDYLKYAKKYNIKTRIIHSHNSQNMDSKLRVILHKFNRLVLNFYATNFWACSEDSAKWFFSKSKIKNKEYKIVKNAIDVEKYKYDFEKSISLKKKINIEDKIILGNVGRFHFQKNQIFLLDIFNEFIKLNNNSLLYLVGQGEDEEKLKNKVKELNIEDKVIFYGLSNKIEDMYNMFDGFVFPSLFEGLPMALLEAQASSLNIYASSDVIPNEAKMTNNYYSISLNESASIWANKINDTIKYNRNEIDVSNITQNGYNIKVESKKMQDFFENI